MNLYVCILGFCLRDTFSFKTKINTVFLENHGTIAGVVFNPGVALGCRRKYFLL
jgi:hypothetical protein